MTQETFTLKKPDNETIEIIKECIASMGGQITAISKHEVNWEFEYRKQIIKCKTLVNFLNTNKIKLKTTANHKKGNKSYERVVINKLHSLLLESIKIPKDKDQSEQKNSSEKINYKSLLWFIGLLLLLFIGGNILKNVNLKSKNELNLKNNENTIEYNSYENYKTVEVPDSIYDKLKVEYGHKNVEKFDSEKRDKFSNFSGKKVKFKSTFYDKERNNVILNTNYEITYHTIDFNRKIVTQKSKLNGHWVEYKYPINGFYEDGLTNVIIVNDLGVKEIWFSPTMLNLGYDYIDGSRIACYGLSLVK